MTFPITSRLVRAAALVNRIPADRFSLLVTRVLQKLHLKDERLFSEEETDQLIVIFAVSRDELSLILDCTCYLFEQAAYTSTGPEDLFQLLLEAQFDEVHSKVIGKSWAAEAAGYVAQLKSTTLGYRCLVDTEYHLHMVLAQSGLTRQQESRAVFEFTLAGNDNDLLITASDGTKSSNSLADTPASQTDQKEKFFVEFSHPELFSFFNDLDRIQKQLDSMT